MYNNTTRARREPLTRAWKTRDLYSITLFAIPLVLIYISTSIFFLTVTNYLSRASLNVPLISQN